MQKQPLLISLICFIIGILLYDEFPMNSYIVFGLFGLGMLAVLSTIRFRRFRTYTLYFFFFSVGLFSHYFNSIRPEIQDFEGKQNVIFKLNKKLNSNGKNRRYEISVLRIDHSKAESLPLNLVVSIPKDLPQLDFLNYYQTEIYLNKVESPNNDFQFDYARYLGRKNIYHQSFINSLIPIPKQSLSFQDQIAQQRLDILRSIDKSSLHQRNKEFLKGIILADRTEMDAETVSDFNKSGLVHLLAISGSHMVIIFWLIMLVFGKILPLNSKKSAIIVSLLLIWSFAAFIGFGSSVTRSCIMITAYYIYVLLQRKPDLLHAMALAGFVILITDTHQVFDVGFQLSFLAVLGIYWLNQPILKYLPKPKNKFQNFLVNIPSVSLSAQLATLPLVIYYFHQYSFISILANLFIIPFSEIIIISSLVMTFLFAMNYDFAFLNVMYDKMVSALLISIKWFASLDFVFVKNLPISLWEVAVLLLSMYFIRDILVKKDLKSTVSFMSLLMLFFTLRLGFNIYNFKKDEVLFTNYFREKILISKSKNEAVFYMKPGVDPAKTEKFIVEPYLNSRRISNFKIEQISPSAKIVQIGNRRFDMD